MGVLRTPTRHLTHFRLDVGRSEEQDVGAQARGDDGYVDRQRPPGAAAFRRPVDIPVGACLAGLMATATHRGDEGVGPPQHADRVSRYPNSGLPPPAPHPAKVMHQVRRLGTECDPWFPPVLVVVPERDFLPTRLSTGHLLRSKHDLLPFE
ncbi:hypothetical protein GCM10022243_67360 [Saccharothrix violaceirubra]